MTPRAVRRVVIAVCVAGVAGMIAGSIADNSGAALTAGLVTAGAVLCLMVSSAVAQDAPDGPDVDPLLAGRLEEQVGSLVAAGVDEQELRALVRTAVTLGRRRAP
jgi:hypothetical protein